jgi:hypothetical protein
LTEHTANKEATAVCSVTNIFLIFAAKPDHLLPATIVNIDPRPLVKVIAKIFPLVAANFTKNKNALRQRNIVASGLEDAVFLFP